VHALDLIMHNFPVDDAEHQYSDDTKRYRAGEFLDRAR